MADQLRPWYDEETAPEGEGAPLFSLPFTLRAMGQGSTDPYGTNVGGDINLQFPFLNGMISGGVSGNMYKNDYDTGGALTGGNLQYDTEDYSLGGQYFNNGEYPGQGFMGRGTIRYADGGDVIDPLNADPRLAAWKRQQEQSTLPKINSESIDNYLRNSPLFGYHNPVREVKNFFGPAFDTESERPMRYRVLDTIGAGLNFPVRAVTRGDYSTVDVLQGLTGKDFPAVRESEARFYENNPELLKTAQGLGEVLPLGLEGFTYAPTMRFSQLPEVVAAKNATKNAVRRFIEDQSGSVQLGKTTEPELPSLRRINQTPFYGEDVGPKGRISDPLSQVERLQLRGGLPEAPTEGFFNPASAALLQEGVQPKQTVTYFKKQLGSRGGKLPPGQWEEITKGLGPDDVVERDWLVKKIDERSPDLFNKYYANDETDLYSHTPENIGDLTKRTFEDVDSDLKFDVIGNPEKGYKVLGPDNKEIKVNQNDFDLSTDYDAEMAIKDWIYNFGLKNPAKKLFQGVPKYESWKTEGPFSNYTEGVIGYLENVPAFKDTHFREHPNIEGWYRSQDIGPGRILEEVQPQRQEKFRSHGQSLPKEEFDKLDNSFRERMQKKEELEKIIESKAQKEFLKKGTIASDILNIPDSSQRWENILNKAVDKFDNNLGGTDYVFADGSEARQFRGINDVRWEIAVNPKKMIDLVKDATKENPEFVKLSNEINDLSSKLNASRKGVSPSPYSHDVNEATDFLVKRALLDASKEGKSWVGWTPGEVQNERYDLSKHIDQIHYEPNNDNTFEVRALNPEGKEVFQSGSMNEKSLEETFGKEITKKITSNVGKEREDAPLRDWRVLSGLDMQVGGEGMNKFYGSGEYGEGGILPERLKSIVKRVTGEKPLVNKQELTDLYPNIRRDFPNGYKYRGNVFERERELGKELGLNEEEADLIPKVISDYKYYGGVFHDAVIGRRIDDDAYGRAARAVDKAIQSGDLKPIGPVYPRIDLPEIFKVKSERIGLPVYSRGGPVSIDEDLPRLRPLN